MRSVRFSTLVSPESSSFSFSETLAQFTSKSTRLTSASSRDGDEGVVGLINLPLQIYRKSVQKGFEFNLMVVGESGLGKSTLINSMFKANIYDDAYPGPSDRVKKTLRVESCQVMLKEEDVRLTLNIVDTPGFGDAVDNTDCWQDVLDFVNSQFEDYLRAEMRLERQQVPDQRIHACLYFIPPNGHALRNIDLAFMSNLHDKVNIVPVVGKADSLTPEELVEFKKRIRQQISDKAINVYEGDKEAEVSSWPFAVVGSNCVIENKDGNRVRGRRYPWGTVNIEDSSHCDFLSLRHLLIGSAMHSLRSLTHTLHYERFRYERLAAIAGPEAASLPKCPLAVMEEELETHKSKLVRMQREMEEVFSRKVAEKREAMAISQREFEARVEENKENLRKMRRDLEMRKKIFDQEVDQWERQNKMSIEDLFRATMNNDLFNDNTKRKKVSATLSGVSFKLGR